VEGLHISEIISCFLPPFRRRLRQRSGVEVEQFGNEERLARLKLVSADLSLVWFRRR